MYLSRHISSVVMSSRSILVTDPALVKSGTEAKTLLTRKDLAVRLRVAESLFKKLETKQTGSKESFVFGKCIGPATLIGQHESDSGLTCITEDLPFGNGVEEEDVFDWTELVMTTLSSLEVVCEG